MTCISFLRQAVPVQQCVVGVNIISMGKWFLEWSRQQQMQHSAPKIMLCVVVQQCDMCCVEVL